MPNRIDPQYRHLLDHILHFGVEKKDRTGTGTKSIFGWQIRHNMKDGFPLLTTKKMAWKSVVTELLWFLRGDTNIKFLVDNGCHIWDGDAYKNYCKWYDSLINSELSQKYTKEEFINKIKTDDKFAREWGNLGPIYGAQWRMWSTEWAPIDQIQNLINELKTNPHSRRLMVNAWNVGELDEMVLPPCHYGFQIYTRELSARERTALYSNGSARLYDSIKEENYATVDADETMHTICDEFNVPRRTISLMWNQRSVDTFLGLPFNIASYALLLEIIAKMVNMIPEELIGNLGDTHLYLNHIEQSKEQISRTPYELPKLKFEYGFENLSWFLNHPKKDENGNRKQNYNEFFNQLKPEWFTLENYQSHSVIKAPLSN